MYIHSKIIELPTELLLVIFQNLLICKHHSKSNDMCKCWCLDVMNAATVCKTWYNLLFKNIIPGHDTNHTNNEKLLARWPETLINDMGPERTYPYLKRTINVLKDSRKYHLDLHLQVQHLVIDFAMLNGSLKQQGNELDSEDTHHQNYTDDIIQLLNICSNIETLGIMYDTKFISLVTQGTIFSDSIQQLSTFVQQQKGNKINIKQLDLVGYNPVQRCPCCSGKEWDHLLVPLLDALPLTRLVLRHVVPTPSFCEALTRQKTLSKLTLFRSMMTIPSDDKTRLPVSQRPTSIERIPDKVWKQIKQLAILEESEDSSMWPTRYLDKISERVSKLEKFSLVFGSLEENTQYLKNEGNMFLENTTMIPENNKFGTALICLISATSESLKQMLLVNVPNIKSGHVWF